MKNLFIILLIIPFASLGQKREANNWFWGDHAALSFNIAPPKPLFDSMIFTSSSAGSISDSVGKLLFYTDGDWLFRNNAVPIFIRSRLGINIPIFFYNTASLIIPNYFKKNRYWLFVVPSPNDSQPKFNYPVIASVVDMSLDGGKGNLDTNSVFSLFSRGESTIASMLHADSKRQWLIGRWYNSDTLLAWRIDSSSIASPVVSKIGSPYLEFTGGSNTADNYGRERVTKTSPNSEFLFWDLANRRTRCNQLLKFNRDSGTFSDLIHIVDSIGLNPNSLLSTFPVDAAFSPDSRYLYTVENTYQKPYGSIPNNQNRLFFTIRQYDLSIWDSAVIKNSAKVIFRSPPQYFLGPNGVGSMTCQLGPDGKIYFQEFNQTRLSVMHCPNSSDGNVNFKFREINTQRKGGFRLPALNQTLVRNAGIFQLQANRRSICQRDTLELSGYGAGAERFQWSVSPAFPASVKLDTLTWQKIPTRQLAPGTYTFSCRAFSRCGDVFEKTISVEIKPIPGPTQPPRKGGVSTPCLGDSVFLFVPNPQPGYRYYWSNGDTTATIVVKESGNYSLDSVSNSFGCGIKVGDTVAVAIKNVLVPYPPVLASPQLVEVCAGVQNSTLKVQSTGSSVVWNTGQTGDSVSVPGAGKYWAIHQTEEGCTSGASDTITVVVEPLPVVQLVASDNGHCLGNEETKEYKVLNINSKVKTVEVEGGQVVEETDSTLTIHWFEGTQTQAPWEDFNIKIKSQNRLGCAGADVVFSPVPNPESCRELYPLFIPNLVTVNHDNHNDRWEMGNVLYHQPVSVRIYNRWGQTVFETDSYQNNWPTTSLSSGTYFYRVASFGKEWKGWMTVN